MLALLSGDRGPADLTVTLAPASPAPSSSQDDLDTAMGILENRALGLGVPEVEVTQDGEAIVVDMWDVEDPERTTELITATGELRFRPVLQAVPTEALADLGASPELTPPEEDAPDTEVTLEGIDGSVYTLGPTLATGEIVETAEADLSEMGTWVVALRFRDGPEGLDRFNEAAAVCFEGQDPTCPTAQLAIVLDSQVQSAPAIQQPGYERDGAVIQGPSIGEQEATDLAVVLQYGALPVELELQSVSHRSHNS